MKVIEGYLYEHDPCWFDNSDIWSVSSKLLYVSPVQLKTNEYGNVNVTEMDKLISLKVVKRVDIPLDTKIRLEVLK